jgi:hypothetical protein
MLYFKDFSLFEREKIQKYTFETDFHGCDLAFANLFIWKFYFYTQIAENDDFIFIRYWHNNKLYFMLPLGKGDLKNALFLIEENAKNENQTFCLQGLTPKMKAKVEEIFPEKFEFVSNRNFCDYIYLREELVRLAGKKFQSKRNHINQFLRAFPDYEFLKITPEIISQCIDLERVWEQRNKTEEETERLGAERKAITTALENFDELGLKGGALKVNGKIAAFTYGSPINSTTFDIACEKANTEIIGAYAMINNLFAKSIEENFIYINREEDLGIEGLRKAKLSYQPYEILSKFTAKIKNIR